MTLRDCTSVGAGRASWQPARWYPFAETVVTGVAVARLARNRRWRAVTTIAASWTGGRLATTGIGARPWSGGGVAYGLGRIAPPWRIPLLAMSGVAELLRRDGSAGGLGQNPIGWIAGVAGAGAAVRVVERASDRRRHLSSRRQVAVVINAFSGSPHLARRAVATMRRQPVDIVSLETTTGTDLLASLERALKSLKPEGILVVAGGDGTVGCAAARAAEAGRTLAILPTGTGNDIARSLGLPLNPEEAVDLIAETDPSPMDLVATENGVFAHAASVGMIADFATRVRDTHGWRRPLVYPAKAWRAWREHKLLDVDVVIDGHPVFLSGLPYQVAVINAPRLGGRIGFTLPGSAPDDGFLDVVISHTRGLRQSAQVIAGFMGTGSQRHWPGATVVKGSTVEIRSPDPLVVSLDGEPMGFTPLRAEVQAQCCYVLRPRS